MSDNVPGPDDPTFLRDEQDPAAGGAERPAEVGDAMAEIHKRGQLKGKEEIKGKIRVLSRKDLEEIIAGLLKKYGSLSNQDLIAQLGALEMQSNQDRQKHERELEALRAQAEASIAQARAEGNDALEALRREHEAALAAAREAALAEVRERIVELERLLETERARTGELEARIAALEAELDKVRSELAIARKAIDTDDKRTREQLMKRIAELEARVFELEMALDYFSLEEEFDFDRFTAEAEALAGRLQGAAGEEALRIYSRAKEIQAAGTADHAKFQALLAKMYEQKGSIGVVVDLAKLLKRCEAAAARSGDVAFATGGGK